MIEIVKASPYATVQDQGFARGRSFGLPEGGAMDPLLARLANTSLGNSPGAAIIEWSLGPLSFRLARAGRITGLGQAEVRIGDTSRADAIALPLEAGQIVMLVPGPRPVFNYLAVQGGIAVEPVLGARSTYVPGGFGGFEGRRLRTGDALPMGASHGSSSWSTGEIAERVLEVQTGKNGVTLRVIRGPQWDRFDQAMQQGFLSASFTVDRASDRMGYRLTGPTVAPNEQATLPSEAACPGAVQVPDNGQPIVIMPDGPTVGGYPKIATVIRSDLRLLAQSPPGTVIRFREVSLEEARRIILLP